MSPLLLAHREGGVRIEPAGTRHATITPYGPFVASDGVVVNIAVQNDRQWQLLCEVLDLADHARDARFATNFGRLQHRDEVEGAVAEAVSSWPHVSLEEALDRQGIPWGRLNETADVAVHPQLEATEGWRQVELPHGDCVRVVAGPFSRNRESGGPAPRVPGLGEHTAEIIDELARRDGE
jgi:itaconate CoA-transferase